MSKVRVADLRTVSTKGRERADHLHGRRTILLAGCAASDQVEDEDAAAFGSIDDAYTAIDEVLRCDSDPVGEPIVPMGESGKLASEQRLCAEHVQIDLYPDEAALQSSYDIWADSHQGKVHLVRGDNWLVVDVTDAVTGAPTPWDIPRVAEELNGQYTTAGA